MISSHISSITYRICNPTVDFLKYELNNKLMDSVTLFKITTCVT